MALRLPSSACAYAVVGIMPLALAGTTLMHSSFASPSMHSSFVSVRRRSCVARTVAA